MTACECLDKPLPIADHHDRYVPTYILRFSVCCISYLKNVRYFFDEWLSDALGTKEHFSMGTYIPMTVETARYTQDQGTRTKMEADT